MAKKSKSSKKSSRNKSKKRSKPKKKTRKKAVKKTITKKKAAKKVSKARLKKVGKPVEIKTKKRVSVFKRRPLPASFMLIGIFGLIVTAVYTVSGKVPLTWGFTFIVFFLIMFIAALVSLEPNPGEI